MKEKDIQKQVIDFLRIKGFLVVKFPSVGIYKQKTNSYIPQSRKGISDLLACSPKGRFMAIEIKYGKNKASKEQQDFIEEVNDKNGYGFIAYSVDDVINMIRYL